MNAFVDTNVPIAYTFLIDPFNSKSLSVFSKYVNLYWSNCVKLEFIDDGCCNGISKINDFSFNAVKCRLDFL